MVVDWYFWDFVAFFGYFGCSFRTEFKAGTFKPKSVIRHAESVSDWENEAFGQIARFCPHPVPRYAST